MGVGEAVSKARLPVLGRRKPVNELGRETTPESEIVLDGDRRARVLFVEMPVFNGIAPLASGYMQAYAQRDVALKDRITFRKKVFPLGAKFAEMLAAIEAESADVYAFSVYVWNAGIVRSLLERLRESCPRATFLLGGPQVMHHASQYVKSSVENVYVCNGEGERTFTSFMKQFLGATPDYASVRGLSFYRGGELVTTPEEPRISDMSEIPSPYLEGVFEPGEYTWYLIETNRGCPFKCNYCYWGAATGAKVFKYDVARVEAEIEWLCTSGALHFHICDANWGMLQRDVEFSRLLADCKAKYGVPYSVYFTTSKNTPDRVNEIAKIFHGAGLLASQTVSLQTMNEYALSLVNRENIRTSAYITLQQQLNDTGMASSLEMIWPLPGETLTTFKEGLGKLCELRAQSFMIYTLLLMNNVGLNAHREEYGLVTVDSADPASEAQRVIATKWVNEEEYVEGLRFTYGVHCLYDHHSLRAVLRYLDSQKISSYVETIDAFVAFCRARPNEPLPAYMDASICTGDHDSPYDLGGMLHMTDHVDRPAFDAFLLEFAESQPWWSDAGARFCFEVDLLNRPYVYRDTPIAPKRYAFEFLKVETLSTGYLVDVPAAQAPLLAEVLETMSFRPALTHRYEINHRREQMPFMPHKSAKDLYGYCQSMMYKGRGFLGLWADRSVHVAERAAQFQAAPAMA